MDRIEPTRRPKGPAVMRQRWARLLFLHWPAPAEKVRSSLPPGLELDTHDGQAWIGLVPFVVTGARPVFVPALPGLSNFDEVNVRTYVHHRGRDPGVWFFSLDASSRIAVAAARALFKLAYRNARTEVRVSGERVRFESRRVERGAVPAECAVEYEPKGAVRHAVPGTLEHFLLERYVLYAADREGLYQGRVHHEPYPVQDAVTENLHESLVAAAGLPRPHGAPLAHYASAVHVEVFPLRTLAGG